MNPIVFEYGESDVILSGVVESFTEDVGLVGRYLDDENYLLFQVRTNQVALWRKEQDEWTRLDMTLVSASPDAVLEFHLVGASLVGYLNGEPLCRATEGFNRIVTQHGTRLTHPGDVITGFAAIPAVDAPPKPIVPRLQIVPAYFPNDLRYADPEF